MFLNQTNLCRANVGREGGRGRKDIIHSILRSRVSGGRDRQGEISSKKRDRRANSDLAKYAKGRYKKGYFLSLYNAATPPARLFNFKLIY